MTELISASPERQWIALEPEIQQEIDAYFQAKMHPEIVAGFVLIGRALEYPLDKNEDEKYVADVHFHLLHIAIEILRTDPRFADLNVVVGCHVTPKSKFNYFYLSKNANQERSKEYLYHLTLTVYALIQTLKGSEQIPIDEE